MPSGENESSAPVASGAQPSPPEDDAWGGRTPVKFVMDEKVLTGKDGWLFLDHDSNWLLGQYTGRYLLTPEELEQWRKLLEARTERCASLGARYYFTVVPETPAVYPEKLPDGITVTDERIVMQLIRKLAATNSPARVVYALDDL